MKVIRLVKSDPVMKERRDMINYNYEHPLFSALYL